MTSKKREFPPHDVLVCERGHYSVRYTVDCTNLIWFAWADIFHSLGRRAIPTPPDTLGILNLSAISPRAVTTNSIIRSDIGVTSQYVEAAQAQCLSVDLMPHGKAQMLQSKDLNGLFYLLPKRLYATGSDLIYWLGNDVVPTIRERGYYRHSPNTYGLPPNPGLYEFTEKKSAALTSTHTLARKAGKTEKDVRKLLASAGMLCRDLRTLTPRGKHYALLGENGRLQWPENIRDIIRGLS